MFRIRWYHRGTNYHLRSVLRCLGCVDIAFFMPLNIRLRKLFLGYNMSFGVLFTRCNLLFLRPGRWIRVNRCGLGGFRVTNCWERCNLRLRCITDGNATANTQTRHYNTRRWCCYRCRDPPRHGTAPLGLTFLRRGTMMGTHTRGLFVLVKIRLQRESLSATPAYVRFRVRMGLNVSSKVWLVGKRLVTDCTFERLFSCSKNQQIIIKYLDKRTDKKKKNDYPQIK